MTSVHLPLMYERSNIFSAAPNPKLVYPIKLSIDESMIPASTATMICTRDEIYKRSQVFELYTANGLSGYYRIRSIDIDYGRDIVTYQLEHMIAEVGDWTLINDIAGNKTERTAIRQLWRGVDASSTDDNNYRGDVWQLGSVTVLSDSTTVELDVHNGDNLLSCINDVVRECAGVYMKYDFDAQPWIINFSEAGTGSANEAVYAYGILDRNVSSARVFWDYTDIATRVRYCYNNTWRSYTASQTIRDRNGLTEYPLSTTGASSLAAAQYAAQQYLARNQEPQITVEIEGYDLSSITGVSTDKFAIGKDFGLYLPELGSGFYRPISRIKWHDVYGDPLRTTVTLGENDAALWGYLEYVKMKK